MKSKIILLLCITFIVIIFSEIAISGSLGWRTCCQVSYEEGRSFKRGRQRAWYANFMDCRLGGCVGRGSLYECGYSVARSSENFPVPAYQEKFVSQAECNKYHDNCASSCIGYAGGPTISSGCNDKADNDRGADPSTQGLEGCDLGGFCAYTGAWPLSYKYMGADKDCSGDNLLIMNKDVFLKLTEKALIDKYGEKCIDGYWTYDSMWGGDYSPSGTWICTQYQSIFDSQIKPVIGATIGYHCAAQNNPIFSSNHPKFGSGITDCCRGSGILENNNISDDGTWYCDSGNLSYCGSDREIDLKDRVGIGGVIESDVSLSDINVVRKDIGLYNNKFFCDGTKWLEEPDVAKEICISQEYNWLSYAPEIDPDVPHLNNYCCGDDVPGDGGYLTDSGDGLFDTGKAKFACVNDTENNWEWKYTGTVPGNIYHIVNGNYDVVGDGDRWVACDAKGNGAGVFDLSAGDKVSQGEQVLAGHHYVCLEKNGVEMFAECKGDVNTVNENLRTDREYSTGQLLIADDGAKYFCTNLNYQWITNLDDTNKRTCESVNLTWTGSQCCGDDPNDSYNDLLWPGQPALERGIVGGCFQNKKIDNNTLPYSKNLVKKENFPSNIIYPWIGSHHGVSSNRIMLQSEFVEQDVSEFLIPGQQYVLMAVIQGTGKISVTEGGSEVVSAGVTASPTNELVTVTYPPSTNTNVKVKLSSDTGSGWFSNIQLNYSSKDIMNYNGTFYSCNQESSILIQGDSPLIPASQNLPDCSVLGDYYCSPDNQWKLSAGSAAPEVKRNTSKTTPEGYTPSSASCCNTTQCWNGTWCVDAETETIPKAPIIQGETIYRCINGNWQDSKLRYDWNNKETGFCPEVPQCMVDLGGSSANNNKPEMFTVMGSPNNPQCISNGQFVGDHYCTNGTWETRTKLLALQLLNLTNKISPEKFSLFCDHYKKSLVNYDYSTIETTFLRGSTAGGIPGAQAYTCDSETAFECVNHVCVLKIEKGNQEHRIMAVSLNKPINDSYRTFLKAIDPNMPKDYCNNLIGQKKSFDKCDATNDRLWYSDALNAIIFTNSAGLLEFEPPTTWENFINFLKSIFTQPTPSGLQDIKEMVDYVSANEIKGYREPAHNWSFANKIHNYDKLYISKSLDRLVYGVLEKPINDDENLYNEEFMIVGYNGFNQDLCMAIKNYVVTHESSGDSNCTKVDGTYYFISTEENVKKSWPDAASKLRIS